MVVVVIVVVLVIAAISVVVAGAGLVSARACYHGVPGNESGGP